MTLGHLGQFDEIHCDSRTHKVLSNYILVWGFFFVVYGVFKYTCSILPLLIFLVSGVFWGILKPFAFFVFLFCHPFGGRDSLKKRKIHEEFVSPKATCFFHERLLQWRLQKNMLNFCFCRESHFWTVVGQLLFASALVSQSKRLDFKLQKLNLNWPGQTEAGQTSAIIGAIGIIG